MDFSTLIEFYNQFSWFVSLGYVTIIATFLTMGLVELLKATALKKCLKDADANKKDKVLSLLGSGVSLVIFAACHFGNEMILQHTFFINFNEVTQAVSITSGAAITWVAAKGLYTVFHKITKRLKEKKSLKDALKDANSDIDEVKKEVEKVKANEKAKINPVSTSGNTLVVKKEIRVKKK